MEIQVNNLIEEYKTTLANVMQQGMIYKIQIEMLQKENEQLKQENESLKK